MNSVIEPTSPRHFYLTRFVSITSPEGSPCHRHFKLLRVFLLLLVLLIASLTSSTSANTITLTADSSGHVWGQTLMGWYNLYTGDPHVGDESGGSSRGYLGFPITITNLNGATINSVTLYIYCKTTSSSGDYVLNVRNMRTSHSSNQDLWNDAGDGTTYCSSVAGRSTGWQSVTIFSPGPSDLQTYKANGETTFPLGLAADGKGATAFYGTGTYAPYLVVDYTPGEFITPPNFSSAGSADLPDDPGPEDVVMTIRCPSGSSNLGHALQYAFDFGDGTSLSSWSSARSATHTYTAAGNYQLRALARCAQHTDKVSTSGVYSVVIKTPIPALTKTSIDFGTDIPLGTSRNDSFGIYDGVSNPPYNSAYYNTTTFTWMASDNQTWLSLSPTSGGCKGSGTTNVSVTINTTGLAYNTLYSGTVTIVPTYGANKTVTVQFRTQPHTVSTPNTPSGSSPVAIGSSQTYTSGGASCSVAGHSVQYRFDWGDGSYSSWASSSSASHTWSSPGTYQLKAQARCATDNSILSSWSGTKNVIVQTPPDLAMGSVTFSPALVGVGGEVRVDCSYSSANGDGNYYDAGIYLSTDSTITTDDIYLGNIALYSGSGSHSFTDYVVTGATPAGQYYVGVILDYMNQLAESNEGNNAGASSSRLTISAEKPDLTVLAVDATNGTSFVVGDRVYVHARIKNLATNVPAPSSTVYFVLSPDTTITATDTYATHLIPSSLAAQETRDLYDSFIVTTNMVGQYYLGAFIDPGNDIDESNEGNNAACGQRLTMQSASLPPDFAVALITISPSTPIQGGSFNATVTVTNQGNGAGDGGYLNVWVNQPNPVNPGDGTWNQSWRVDTVSVGQSKAFTFTNLTAPSALGTYTFHAFIDGPGKTPESNEANNQLDLSYQVAPLPVPRIILDTDMSADCDDLGAVAVLHALANQGKAEILGMVCNVSDPNSPLCLDAINRYYGRTNIPVGYLNTNSVNPFMNPIFQFFEHYDFNNEYTEYIASHHNHIEPNEVRDALDVYVSLLQTNSGVTIVSIGSLYNLDRLLSERPDLVSNKVAKLVVMGGSYPVLSFPFFDFNFTLAGDAAKRVVANWPTPIVFSGLGGDVITGDGLDILGIPIIGATGLFNNPNVATNNPIMEGYREGTRTTRIDCFLNWAAPIVAVHFRPSWDQIAVLYAVEGISTNFLEVGPGKNIVNLGTNSVSILDTPVLSLTIASNQWGYQSGGNHYYLTNLVSNIELSVRIDSLMTAPVGANPQATKIIGLSGNLAFGSIQTGQTVTATLTIVNTGNAALNVSGINYPLGFSGAWTGNIAAGGSHDVMVTFAPTSVTTYGGSITVNSDANSGVGSISVSGSGMAGATRIIGVSGNLAFGSVQTGQTGMATLIVTNTGNATLHVSSIDYPPGFSGTWSDSIASGGSHTVVVTFTPTALTTYGGTVTVNSDATSGNNTINASGTGTTVATRIIGVSGNLAFGTIQTGQVATTTLIIANTGSSTLNVSGISYPPGFSGTWSDSIASGGSHNVVVTFAPTAVTMYGGTVTVNSDATSGTSALSVSGSGVSMRSISVLSPNGGESWQAGQTNNITWNSSGFSDPVNLELYDGNIFRTIHYDTPNVGSWAWSIPGDIRQGTNYYIFVYWVSNGVITTVRDYSDGPFTISAATNAQTGALQVTISPPGAVGAGAQWQIDGGPWENGGDIVGGLATGIHDVSFKAVAGWTTPTSQTSTVTEGQTNVLLANYIQVPGPWSDGWEPWWAATTDPDRNMFIADPLGQRGTVLQVWGEHGWWATFRKPIVGGTKYLRAEGWFMAGGGDAGPWIVFRESLDGASAVDVARFGFDDGAVPPTISGHAVQNNVWYKFTFEADVSAGWWKGWVNEVPIAQGAVDTNRTINWICLDAGQPGYFGDVSYLSKSVVCAEDFQSYGVNSWPSANWTADANALSSPNNNRVEYSPSGGTNKVLKLFGAIGGCWAALTYRSCVFPTNFWIECDVYNGAETLTGCHPDRAWISMRSGASWRNPGRWLLAFQGPRTISGSDVALGTYQPGRWYHVAINYCRSGTNLTVGYWINGAWAGQAALTVDNLSQEQSLDHIELTAQEGSAFFDNLSVYTRAAQAATDSDGCGLPDWWKLLFFGTITGVDPYADPDHDGIINLHEFFAGTSPIDSNSALQVKGIAWEGSAVNIRFQSVNGKRYAVEYADSIGAASWMPLFAESVLGDGSEMSIRAPVSTDAGSRFYRIRVLNW